MIEPGKLNSIHPQQKRSYSFGLLSVLVGVLSSLLFLPGVYGAFLLDDAPNIVGNSAIHISQISVGSLANAAFSFQPGGGSRSLPMLTFALNYYFDGLNPLTYKLTNIFIHALTIISIAFFFRKLLIASGESEKKSNLVGLALSTFWGIHTLQISSVLYVVQRMQSMSTLMIFLSLTCYLYGRDLEARSHRLNWLLFFFFAGLAFLCKEDAALIPVLILVIEATVLRFRANRAIDTERLKKGAAGLVILAACTYAIVVVPHYWTWDAYASRDFSSWERLLTQTRVLVLYLTQSLMPTPQLLHFYYDDYQVSRGLLNPISTAFCLVAILFLLWVALKALKRWPLFSFGILWFLGSHAITSNIVGLELVFEHRQQLGLAGLLLSLYDLLNRLNSKFEILKKPVTILTCIALLVIGAGTISKARIWGSPELFVEESTRTSPGSARAWLVKCGFFYKKSQKNPSSPYFDRAIEACDGGKSIDYSASLPANLVIFKTIKGNVSQADWDLYLYRLRHAQMSVENRYTLDVMLNNFEKGVRLDPYQLWQSINIIARRSGFSNREYIRYGFFAMYELHDNDLAFTYFVNALRHTRGDDPLIDELFAELTRIGKGDWNNRLIRFLPAGDTSIRA